MNTLKALAGAGLISVGLAAAALAADQDMLVAQGQEVFTRVCFDCHNATEPNPDMVAPPIFAAKNHYARFAAREDFVAAVSGYLLNPTAEAAQMPGAVQKFGVMPPPEITAGEATAVAEYLFATDFSLPDWYAVHYQQEHGEAPVEN